MGKAEERHINKIKIHDDPFYDEQPLNELDNDIMGSLIKATRPEINGPDFKRYTNADKNKNLPQIMEQEEAKEVKKTENKKKSKDNYAVKNHFLPSKSKKGKKKANARPRDLKEADDEVEQYMKELGLM